MAVNEYTLYVYSTRSIDRNALKKAKDSAKITGQITPKNATPDSHGDRVLAFGSPPPFIVGGGYALVSDELDPRLPRAILWATGITQASSGPISAAAQLSAIFNAPIREITKDELLEEKREAVREEVRHGKTLSWRLKLGDIESSIAEQRDIARKKAAESRVDGMTFQDMIRKGAGGDMP